MKEDRIPVIIVSYHNGGDVTACLSALSRMRTDPAFSVFICENGGSAAFDVLISSLCAPSGPCIENGLAKGVDSPISRFSRVRRLRLRTTGMRVLIAEARENYGYGAAVNAWLRALRTLPAWPGIWVLHPKTRPEADALAELVNVAATRRKGMVGSRIVCPRRPGIVVTRGFRWCRYLASTRAIGRNAPASVEPDPQRIETSLTAPSGISIYVTRRCLDYIGLMDERYFLYLEDLDWGYRAKRTCGIGYAHNSIVFHDGDIANMSIGCQPKTSRLSVYLQFRNRVNFVRYHYPSWIVWTVLILAIRSLKCGMADPFQNLSIAFRGLLAGIFGETGKPDRLLKFDGPSSATSTGSSQRQEVPR